MSVFLLYGVESELTRNKLTVCGDLGRGPQSFFLLLLDGIVVSCPKRVAWTDGPTVNAKYIFTFVKIQTRTNLPVKYKRKGWELGRLQSSSLSKVVQNSKKTNLVIEV